MILYIPILISYLLNSLDLQKIPNLQQHPYLNSIINHQKNGLLLIILQLLA